jgi:hypothetical protein
MDLDYRRTIGAGKGDYPRNTHTRGYKENFSEINWGRETPNETITPTGADKRKINGKQIFKY